MTEHDQVGDHVRQPRAVCVMAVAIRTFPSEIAYARNAVVDFAARHDVPRHTLDDIGLAVGEAVTNAVRHAYPEDTVGPAHVIADLDDEAVEVVVADEGRGLRAGGSRPGAGLGLSMIVRLADQVTIGDSNPHGLSVWMRFLC